MALLPLLLLLVHQNPVQGYVMTDQRDTCRALPGPQVWDHPCWLPLGKTVFPIFGGEIVDFEDEPRFVVRYGPRTSPSVGTYNYMTSVITPLPGSPPYDPATQSDSTKILYLPAGSVGFEPWMTRDEGPGSPNSNSIAAVSIRGDNFNQFQQQYLCRAHPENGWGDNAFEPLGLTRKERGGPTYCYLRNRKTRKIHKHDRMEIAVNLLDTRPQHESPQEIKGCPKIPDQSPPPLCTILQEIIGLAKGGLESEEQPRSKLGDLLEKVITVTREAWEVQTN